jgi:hypothetical protein
MTRSFIIYSWFSKLKARGTCPKWDNTLAIIQQPDPDPRPTRLRQFEPEETNFRLPRENGSGALLRGINGR